MANFLNKDLTRQTMTMNSMNLHTGNPAIDSLLAMFLNPMGLMAAPGKGQSVLDAQNIRSRSMDQMALMRFGMGNSLLGQHLGGAGGLNMDSTLAQFAAPLASGFMDNPIMQAINGGNPVKAIMGMKANNTGMTMGMGFGRITDADNNSVKAAFREFQKGLFKTRTITGEDMKDLTSKVSKDAMSGLSEESRSVMSDFVRKGPDGKEFFDYAAYQAEGSGRKMLGQSIQERKASIAQSLTESGLTQKTAQGVLNQNGDIDVDKLEQIKEKTKNFTEKVGAGMTDAALKALEKADQNSQKIKQKQDKIVAAIGELDRGDKTISDFRNQIGEFQTQSINSQTMRGYSIDQFTKAWDMSKDLGLSSLSWKDRTDEKMSLSDKMAKSAAGFARNAGKALRAVSDLTGAETAQGSMEDLNSLLGNSRANLGTEQGSGDIESLVRRFKASARTAGVGIDAVMSILNEVKALSSSHPQLQYSGGSAAMETSIKSLNTTTALTAAMGSDWVRTMGGSAELSRQTTETLTKNKIEPVSLKSKGLVGLIANSNMSEAEKKKALDKIEQFDAGYRINEKGEKVKHTFSNSAWASLYEDLSPSMNMSVSQLHRGTLSEANQIAGQVYADSHTERDFDQGAIQATGRAFETAVGLGVANDGKTVIGPDGKVMTGDQRKKGFLTDVSKMGESGKNFEELVAKYQLGDIAGLDRLRKDKHSMMNFRMYALQNDETYVRQSAMAKEATKGYAEAEAALGEKFAQLNQPFNQTLVQSFFNGDFGEGKQGLLNAISNDPARARAGSMLDAVQLNLQNKTGASFKGAMLETLGGAASLSEEDVKKNLLIQGRGDETASVLSRRKALMEEGGMEHFEKVAGDLTIGQLSTNYTKETYGTLSEDIRKKHSLSDIQRAQIFMDSTGIIDGETKKKHAKSKFSDVRDTIPMREALVQTANLTYNDVRKDAESHASNTLKANFQALEDGIGSKNDADKADQKRILGEELGLYYDAGYLSLKDSSKGVSKDNIDWDASKKGLGRFMDDIHSLNFSDGLTSKLNKGGIRSQKDFEALSQDEQKELLAQGAAVRDTSGKLRLDEKGIGSLEKRQRAVTEAESAQAGGAIKHLAEILGTAQDKKAESLETAQKDLDKKIFEDIKTALGNGSAQITSVLEKISASLAATLKG